MKIKCYVDCRLSIAEYDDGMVTWTVELVHTGRHARVLRRIETDGDLTEAERVVLLSTMTGLCQEQITRFARTHQLRL